MAKRKKATRQERKPNWRQTVAITLGAEEVASLKLMAHAVEGTVSEAVRCLVPPPLVVQCTVEWWLWLCQRTKLPAQSMRDFFLHSFQNAYIQQVIEMMECDGDTPIRLQTQVMRSQPASGMTVFALFDAFLRAKRHEPGYEIRRVKVEIPKVEKVSPGGILWGSQEIEVWAVFANPTEDTVKTFQQQAANFLRTRVAPKERPEWADEFKKYIQKQQSAADPPPKK